MPGLFMSHHKMRIKQVRLQGFFMMEILQKKAGKIPGGMATTHRSCMRKNTRLAKAALTRVNVTENIAGYPEFSMFGEIPAYGLYVRHTDNITLKNIKILLAAEDFRPAFIFDDVKSVDVTGLGLPVNMILPAIILNRVGTSSIKDATPAESKNLVKKQ